MAANKKLSKPKAPKSTARAASPSRKKRTKQSAAAKPARETAKTANRRKKPSPKAGSRSKAPARGPARSSSGAFHVVGVGASAGGLEALEAFFGAVSADCGLAFVVVVHLDPRRASLLPELLQKRCELPVRTVKGPVAVEPNRVYVIPPNKELTIDGGTLRLGALGPARGARLPIDTFFRSLAAELGRRAAGIVLSGTGTDGTLGLRAIKGEAGLAMAQDTTTAKHDGMPRSAIATGLVDYVLAPADMPAQLTRYAKHAAARAGSAVGPLEDAPPSARQKILARLRARMDHDFSLYKHSTINRRIERRMHVHQIDELADYARFVADSDREVAILFQELLIGVTSFFRDGAAFDVLRNDAVPALIASRPEGHTLRAWVPGCSTGEEAYSLAMIFAECSAELGRPNTVQLFGTDIDESAIETARAGLYPASIAADVPPARLKRFFIEEEEGSYRIHKSIRETLVFAKQNLIKSPPFTKLDVISCRNLLIYLRAEAQRKLLPLFHYALRPEGLLFLGSSETAGPSAKLFRVVDKKWKIFRRDSTNTAVAPAFNLQETSGPIPPEDLAESGPMRRAEQISALQLVETILQQSETPPCVIIDDTSNVLYVHGRTGRYLEPAEGKVSANVLSMARPGLRTELATAIRRVGRDRSTVVARGLTVHSDGDQLRVDLTVKPVLEHGALRGLMMIVFQEAEGAAPGAAAPEGPKLASPPHSRTAAELERELFDVRESLQTTIEELETSNEELKSTNEELQSTNEELQSTNEELETSKEELQSLNEESTTVNAELQSRLEELGKINDDMKNLLDSTDIATLFLDGELRVRRFTPRATDFLPLSASDAGRPIAHFAPRLLDVDLAALADQVLDDLALHEQEVRSADGKVYAMRVRPYRTTANVIDGVVMTFNDVTAQKKTELALRKLEAKRRSATYRR